MEIITILLSSLIGILSPGGVVTDTLTEAAIRDRLDSAEALTVRIDNAPSYHLLQGNVDRVRIAAQGVFPVADIRIDTVEIETDAIDVDVEQLQDGNIVLDRPLSAGIRVVMRKDDINRALRSPRLTDTLQDLNLDLTRDSDRSTQQSDLVRAEVEFLDPRRVRLDAIFQDQDTGDRVSIAIESGIAIDRGSQLRFIDPVVTADGEAVPSELIQLLAEGISQIVNLRNLELLGITARLLRLEIEDDAIEVAALVHIRP
ncbi:MAG: LmeA family phospholipid-binding protein [Elainellaceae cyanobacterium]